MRLKNKKILTYRFSKKKKKIVRDKIFRNFGRKGHFSEHFYEVNHSNNIS